MYKNISEFKATETNVNKKCEEGSWSQREFLHSLADFRKTGDAVILKSSSTLNHLLSEDLPQEFRDHGIETIDPPLHLVLHYVTQARSMLRAAEYFRVALDSRTLAETDSRS